MARHHDRTSKFLASASAVPATADGAPGLDVLSDVLRTVRLTGALFFRVEASSPWVMELPDGARLAPHTLPPAPSTSSRTTS